MTRKRKEVILDTLKLSPNVRREILEKPIKNDSPDLAFLLIFLQIRDIPINCRDRILKELKWSTPTFYRTIRIIKKIAYTDKSNISLSIILSPAELQGIIKVYSEVLIELTNFIERIKEHYMKKTESPFNRA